jgi:hypothetical protein
MTIRSVKAAEAAVVVWKRSKDFRGRVVYPSGWVSGMVTVNGQSWFWGRFRKTRLRAVLAALRAKKRLAP